MTAGSLNVLIGGATRPNGGSAVRALEALPMPIAAERVVDPDELRERAAEGGYDALIVDADEMGLEPDDLERLRPRLEETRVIVVARSLPAEKAVAFMRAGARDVVTAERLHQLPDVLQ